MASELKVEVIQQETIRPSSPTPHHLKSSNLSVFDQLTPAIYAQLILFYPSDSSDQTNNIDHQFLVSEKSKLLKRSLSETLTHFYPLAGRFQYNVSISCNDHGAGFLAAQVNCPMSKILDKPDLRMLWRLLASPTDHTGYLLQVQVNFFECGGLAIGVSISHKVADALTLSKFINSWAATALGLASTDDHVVFPVEFGAAASLFPPLDFLNSPPSSAVELSTKEKCTTRRFVFDASKIAALKSKAASATVPNPTRSEVVSALIWKCATEASRSNLGPVRLSTWCQIVNMRKVIVQPLANKDLMGNVVASFAAKIEEIEAHDQDLQSLVTKLRKGIEEFKVKYRNGVSGADVCQLFIENGNLMTRDDIDNYSCSSLCRLPFYSSNFGWGKPSWVSLPSVDFKNIIVLMDARDGDGVEASCTFKERDMSLIENNKELLQYASLNPSVIYSRISLPLKDNFEKHTLTSKL